MKILEWIFDNYFKPIIVWLAAMTIVFLKENRNIFTEFDWSIIGLFFKNNWKVLTGLFILTLFITFLIQKWIVYKKKNRRSEKPFFGFVTTSNDRLLTNSYNKYKVYWSVRTMNGNVHVDYIPLCPECQTELDEKSTFWNKFKWSCVNCDFSIKQKDTQYLIREKVQRIAEGSYRRTGKLE